MQHKISQMCDKVSVIYEKTMKLRRLKYDTPKEKQNKDEIDYLVQDIQALCREIAYDTGKYKRVGQDDN